MARSLYWALPEFRTSSFANLDLVVYKSTDDASSEPSTRIAPASPIGIRIAQTQSPSVSQDGNVLYICFIDTSRTICVVTFDMSTGAFGTVNSTGISTSGSDGIQENYAFSLGGGSIQVVYQLFTSSGSTVRLKTVVYSGGSWGAPVTFAGPFAPPPVDCLRSCGLISGGNIGVFWIDDTSPASPTIQYTALSGTTTVSTTFVENFDNIQGSSTTPQFLYDAVSDTAACTTIDHRFKFLRLWLATPSASSPVTSVNTVATDAGSIYDWNNPTLSGNAAGNRFFMTTWDTINNRIQVFTSASLAGSWAGPTTFYDPQINPPSGAVDVSSGLFPSFGRCLASDGSLAVTVYFFYTVSTPDDNVLPAACFVTTPTISPAPSFSAAPTLLELDTAGYPYLYFPQLNPPGPFEFVAAATEFPFMADDTPAEAQGPSGTLGMY